MKKTYILPSLTITKLGCTGIIAGSNLVDNNPLKLNTTTMQEGDGSDAVKVNNHSVWDDDWSK